MSMFSLILVIMYTASVREQEGGTYGVIVHGNIDKYPEEEATLQIYFDTDPAKRDKMVEIVLDELDGFAQNGPSAENLAKVKEFMLKKHRENGKENSYWLSALNRYFWEDIDTDTGYEERVNNITAADLQAFAKALLEQGNRIEVSMTSEATE